MMIDIARYKKSILISILCLLLAAVSTTRLIDDYGVRFTDEGFDRSLVSFAIAKGLNGAISIVQGTEVAIEPAGVGVILTPGQILDPANDLIERFSLVMLISAVALGIQSILIMIFSSATFLIVINISVISLLFVIWYHERLPMFFNNIMIKIAILLLILRFFIPVMAISSDILYKSFLQDYYSESTQQLESSDKIISAVSKEHTQQDTQDKEDRSFFDSIRDDISATIRSFDIDERVEKLQKEVEQMTNHIIRLMVVFILQTIILPLCFLWLTLKAIRYNFETRYHLGSQVGDH